MPRPDLIKTKICLSFLSGTCGKDDCTYAHGLPELRQPRMMVLPDEDLALEPPPPPPDMVEPHQQLAQYAAQQGPIAPQAQGELPQYQQMPEFLPLPNARKNRGQMQQQQQQAVFPKQQRQQQLPHESHVPRRSQTADVAANGACGSDWSLFFEVLGSTLELIADEAEEADPQQAMGPALPRQLAIVGNNPDIVYESGTVPLLLEVLDQSLQLWIEEALIVQKTQLLKRENKWAVLLGAAMRRKRYATCVEGQRLLVIDRSGRLNDGDVPAILCSILQNPAWAHEFPQLVARCQSFLSTKLTPSAATFPQPSAGMIGDMEQSM